MRGCSARGAVRKRCLWREKKKGRRREAVENAGQAGRAVDECGGEKGEEHDRVARGGEAAFKRLQ